MLLTVGLSTHVRSMSSVSMAGSPCPQHKQNCSQALGQLLSVLVRRTDNISRTCSEARPNRIPTKRTERIHTLVQVPIVVVVVPRRTCRNQSKSEPERVAILHHVVLSPARRRFSTLTDSTLDTSSPPPPIRHELSSLQVSSNFSLLSLSYVSGCDRCDAHVVSCGFLSRI